MRPLKLFRRADDRPSLKDRAAGLRDRLAEITRRKPDGADPKRRTMLVGTLAAALPLPALAAMPAPGSEEAQVAFRAACTECDRQTAALVVGYPALRRGPSFWWTTDGLCRALEDGEITPAECARLYPLASERELRMAEIAHRLNLGALHALAWANVYPAA